MCVALLRPPIKDRAAVNRAPTRQEISSDTLNWTQVQRCRAKLFRP